MKELADRIPLDIVPVLPAQLHEFWGFIEPGLSEIQKECNAEWRVEDHYAGLYSARIEGFLILREGRMIGFYDAYPLPVGFGKQDLKYFVYCIWAAKPKDRTPVDLEHMPGDRIQTLEFMKHRARELRCSFIETVSPRGFHVWLGFKEYARIYRFEV